MTARKAKTRDLLNEPIGGIWPKYKNKAWYELQIIEADIFNSDRGKNLGLRFDHANATLENPIDPFWNTFWPDAWRADKDPFDVIGTLAEVIGDEEHAKSRPQDLTECKNAANDMAWKPFSGHIIWERDKLDRSKIYVKISQWRTRPEAADPKPFDDPTDDIGTETIKETSPMTEPNIKPPLWDDPKTKTELLIESFEFNLRDWRISLLKEFYEISQPGRHTTRRRSIALINDALERVEKFLRDIDNAR